MIMFSPESVELKKGYTLNDYIIKRNERIASYSTICRKLGITFDEAKAIYDRVYNVPLSEIGSIVSAIKNEIKE